MIHKQKRGTNNKSASLSFKFGLALLPRIAGGALSSCASSSSSNESLSKEEEEQQSSNSLLGKELGLKYLATHERVLTVTGWQEAYQKERDRFLEANPRLADLFREHGYFKCALPKDYKRLEDVGRFVKRFQNAYPKLKPLYRGIVTICNPEKSFTFYGEPDFTENVKRLEEGVSFWNHLGNGNFTSSTKFANKLIYKISLDLAKQIQEDYELAQKQTPVFLALLDYCSSEELTPPPYR